MTDFEGLAPEPIAPTEVISVDTQSFAEAREAKLAEARAANIAGVLALLHGREEAAKHWFEDSNKALVERQHLKA